MSLTAWGGGLRGRGAGRATRRHLAAAAAAQHTRNLAQTPRAKRAQRPRRQAGRAGGQRGHPRAHAAARGGGGGQLVRARAGTPPCWHLLWRAKACAGPGRRIALLAPARSQSAPPILSPAHPRQAQRVCGERRRRLPLRARGAPAAQGGGGRQGGHHLKRRGCAHAALCVCARACACCVRFELAAPVPRPARGPHPAAPPSAFRRPGLTGYGPQAPYCASKGALIPLAKSLALAW